MPHGWQPDASWQPPDDWPAAPPGWQFWTEEPNPHSEPSTRQRAWRRPNVLGFIVVGIVSCTVVTYMVALAYRSPELNIQTLPESAVMGNGGGVVPDWPMPGSNRVDFNSWNQFGGIDAQFSDEGRSVLLDTHDTTDTWRTKWSGLIDVGPPMCAMRFSGRVRDISHDTGVPGGFAIGLGKLSPESAELSGSAVQFDFGQQGYRTALYPSDTDVGLDSASLDHRWHDVEVTINETSHTLTVDGRTVARSDASGTCGQPVLRVWAGAAEFSDFHFRAADR